MDRTLVANCRKKITELIKKRDSQGLTAEECVLLQGLQEDLSDYLDNV